MHQTLSVFEFSQLPIVFLVSLFMKPGEENFSSVPLMPSDQSSSDVFFCLILLFVFCLYKQVKSLLLFTTFSTRLKWSLTL